MHQGTVCGDIAWDLKAIHDYDFLDLSLGKYGLDLAQLLIRGHENYTGAGVPQGERGLLRRKGGIHRNRYRAEEQDSEVSGRPLGTILAENRDPVTWANSKLLQGADGSSDISVEVGGGNREPFSSFAVEHGAFETVLAGGKENIVEGEETHGSEWNQL
jgi:hypothetical protein